MQKTETGNTTRRGAPIKDEGTHVTDFRTSVNIPGNRIEQLKRIAERHGLPLAAFMRQSVLLRLDELDREVG